MRLRPCGSSLLSGEHVLPLHSTDPWTRGSGAASCAAPSFLTSFSCGCRSEQVQQASDSPLLGLMAVPIFAAMAPEYQARVFEPAPAGMRKVWGPDC